MFIGQLNFRIYFDNIRGFICASNGKVIAALNCNLQAKYSIYILCASSIFPQIPINIVS